LLEGRGAASQIAPGRPLYKQAQVQIENLQVQFEDLLRLQVASTIASFGQIGTFGLAIEQAQTIGIKQPRRIHAQTLVAAWRREIERIEDQSFLTLAKQLAEPQTVEGLKGAIAQVVLISQKRPRRIEAQTLLAQWTKRIEVIEDQPFLDEAIALAKQGKLSAAIEKASTIKSGRTLYAKAQDNVYQWVSELQVAQDRPILDRASELASQGSLGAAIDTASQIGYGRALYSEAAGAIGRWSAELRANSAPPPEPAREYAPAPPQEYAPAPPQEEYAPAPRQEEYAPPPPQEEYAPAPEPYYPPARQEAPAPEPEPYYPPAREPEPYYPPAREPEPYYPPAREPEPYYPPAREEAPAPEPPPPAPAPEPAPPSIPESAGPPDGNLIPE
jgi:soluble cytochrome b562